MAEALGENRTTVRYWIHKHEITPDEYSNLEEQKNAEEKERKPDYVEHDSYFIIYSSNAPGDGYKVEKETVDEFLKLYVQANMTKDKVATELEISRDKLNAIWSAFDITHDSIPFRSKELFEKGPKSLVQTYLKRDKKLFWKYLAKRKQEKAYKELKKYYKKEWEIDRISDKIKKDIKEIDLDKYYKNRNIKRIKNKQESILVVNISDWHKGKVVFAGELLDNRIEGYNKDIFKKRKNKFLKEVLEMIEFYKPEKIYILNYGDGIDDPNHETYKKQYNYQDLMGENQLMSYVDELVDFILDIYQYHDNIFYSGVPGNHSKGEVNWDVLANMILKRMLKDFDIEFDVENRKYKIIKIYNKYIIQCHGEDIRKGKYTGENDILSIINMSDLPLKDTYVIQGHLHHLEKEGVRYRRIYLPSMVGGDPLSSDILHKSSRASQLIFRVTGEGIKTENYVYFD